MKTCHKFSIFSVIAVTFSLAYSTNVAAQAVIEEIIVTATKRGEVSVQNMVGGVRAISGKFIDDHQLRSFEDVARLEPSLQFAKAAVGDLQPIIRGIQSPGAGTVGVYFDESVITGINYREGGGRTPDIGAYDIARVEVLKGPQGTLFGASSMTGAVRIISNKPDAGGFDANMRFGGNTLEDGDSGFAGDGMVNIPVIEDVLALRVVGWYEDRGGFIDEYTGLNAAVEIKDADDVETVGGRISARFTPNEQFTLDGYYLRQEIEVGGPVGFSDELTGANVPITLLQGPPFILGLVATPFTGFAGERILTVPTREANTNDVEMFGFTGEYDLGFGSIVAAVSNYDLDVFSLSDTTGIGTAFGLVDVGRFFGTGIIQAPVPWAEQQNQGRELWSSEIRFSSDFDGPFNFVTGFFYQDDERLSEFMVSAANPADGIAPCSKHAECLEGNPTAIPTTPEALSLLFATDVFEQEESFALFANAEFELNEQLTLGGGVRYYEIEIDSRDRLLQGFMGSDPSVFPPSIIDPATGAPGLVQLQPRVDSDASAKQDEITWEASLGYQITDNQLYYFKVATGFRQGGVNQGALAAAQLGIIIPPSFGPDTVLSLEVGAKTSWYEERVILNAAYFHMFWEDMQVPGQDVTASSEFISNAAEAGIDGVEVELFARPTEQFFLTFGATWLNAELSKDQELDFDPATVGGTIAAGLDGDFIPKVPEWAFSGSAEYAVPFTLLDNVGLALRANFSYTGDSLRFLNSSFENNAKLGDYFLLNLSANFTYENWVFRIFSNNITDEVARIDIFGNGADTQHTVTSVPRSIGAQLQWNFK